MEERKEAESIDAIYGVPIPTMKKRKLIFFMNQCELILKERLRIKKTGELPDSGKRSQKLPGSASCFEGISIEK